MKNLAEALCKAQLELKNPDKDTKGYNYKYADLAGVIDLVKPVLNKHGLSVVQFPVSETGTDRIGVRTVLFHTSGESLEDVLYLPLPEMKQANDTQVAGAAITYARRYALCAVLNISADEDTDGTLKTEKKISEPRMSDYEKAKAEDKGKKDVAEARTYAGYGSLPVFKPATDKQKWAVKVEMQNLLDEGHEAHAKTILGAKNVERVEELLDKISISEAGNLIDAIRQYRLVNEKV